MEEKSLQISVIQQLTVREALDRNRLAWRLRKLQKAGSIEGT